MLVTMVIMQKQFWDTVRIITTVYEKYILSSSLGDMNCHKCKLRLRIRSATETEMLHLLLVLWTSPFSALPCCGILMHENIDRFNHFPTTPWTNSPPSQPHPASLSFRPSDLFHWRDWRKAADIFICTLLSILFESVAVSGGKATQPMA